MVRLPSWGEMAAKKRTLFLLPSYSFIQSFIFKCKCFTAILTNVAKLRNNWWWCAELLTHTIWSSLFLWEGGLPPPPSLSIVMVWGALQINIRDRVTESEKEWWIEHVMFELLLGYEPRWKREIDQTIQWFRDARESYTIIRSSSKDCILILDVLRFNTSHTLFKCFPDPYIS